MSNAFYCLRMKTEKAHQEKRGGGPNMGGGGDWSQMNISTPKISQNSNDGVVSVICRWKQRKPIKRKGEIQIGEKGGGDIVNQIDINFAKGQLSGKRNLSFFSIILSIYHYFQYDKELDYLLCSIYWIYIEVFHRIRQSWLNNNGQPLFSWKSFDRNSP